MKNPRVRRGATLIELLVALLLLDVALLGLASMSAVAARRTGEAGRRSRAAVAAGNRLERLAAAPCAAMAGGTAAPEPGFVEVWAVRALRDAVELTDSIDLQGRSPEQIIVRRRVLC